MLAAKAWLTRAWCLDVVAHICIYLVACICLHGTLMWGWKGTETYAENEVKYCKSQWMEDAKETSVFQTRQGWCTCELTPGKQYLPDTIGWTHIQTHEDVAVNTGPVQVQAKWGEWTWTPIPNWEALSSWQCLTKEKLVSLMESRWVYRSQVRAGPIPSRRCPIQDELNAIFVLYCFAWTFLVFCLYIMFSEFCVFMSLHFGVYLSEDVYHAFSFSL